VAKDAGQLAKRDGPRDAAAVIVFAVKLAPGRSDEDLLSKEVLEETQAQIMTADQARQLGFQGFPDDDNLRLIVVQNSDAGWVEKALERAPQVVGYDKGEVDM
jgi:hypothetical protein